MKDVTVNFTVSDIEEMKKSLAIIRNEAKKLIAEKETYRDFIGERGLTDEYKKWLKVNNWKGVQSMANIINIDDLYILSGEEGMYDSSCEYYTIIIGRETAEKTFNDYTCELPRDDYGHFTLCKAIVKSSIIYPDYNNEIMCKTYNPKTNKWEDEED